MSEAIQQLKIARQWLAFLIDELEIEPEETAYSVNTVNRVTGEENEVAVVKLSDSLAAIDACIASAA